MGNNGEHTFTGKWREDDGFALGLTHWGRHGGSDFTFERKRVSDARETVGKFLYSGSLPDKVQRMIAEACLRVLAGVEELRRDIILTENGVAIRVNVFSCRDPSGQEISNGRP